MDNAMDNTINNTMDSGMNSTADATLLAVHLIKTVPKPGAAADKQIAGALGLNATWAPAYHCNAEAARAALGKLGQVAHVLPSEGGMLRCFVTDGKGAWAATPLYASDAHALASALYFIAFAAAVDLKPA